MLSNLRAYERFIYALPQNYPFIQRSTLVVIPHGATLAELTGTIFFAQDINFTVWEDIDFADEIIHGYSYAVNKGSTRLYWYDPQPHPSNPELASTHPHHKHVPPNIKRNRIPAPGLSFTTPNLPFLIREIEQTLLAL